MKRVIATIVIFLAMAAIALIGWTVFVLSGAYNVSTANHDNRFVNWWLATGTSRSVSHHASSIKAPPLDNPAMIQDGFKEFNHMCVECHGAPGKEPDEIAKGLWPPAPDLAHSAGEWTPAELFWITKNGIKFSAMPGWGATHSDDKIWAMTAFIKQLPKLSPADYHKMETNTVGAEPTGVSSK